MKYRVEQLAAAAGVGVDTVRFYQARGLLPPPRREKRIALYSAAHLERLRQIRRYQSQGLSLAVIKRLLAGRRSSTAAALLAAVADQGGERMLTRAEVAARSGVPEPLLAAIENAGLLHPVTSTGEARYGESDVQIVLAGMTILAQGFPLDELLRLATRHATAIEETVDAAIDLFDRYVRARDREGTAPDTVAETFRRLLPAATTLVALHFQRTLLARALQRLAARGEHRALAAAQAVLDSGHLEVAWR